MAFQNHAALNKLLLLCEQHLSGIVPVHIYEFASCYLWHDRPLYNDFGEQIRVLQGNAIYLYEHSTSPATDLFHELGHMVGRTCNVIGHRENGYRGSWQQNNQKLIAQVTQQRHWSTYLNSFARAQREFKTNAASELWAELFMLWHLYSTRAESRLIDDDMQKLHSNPACAAISQLSKSLRFQTEVDPG